MTPDYSRFSFALFLESILHDSRVALRGLVKKPGFTLLVMLSLGLGIGSSTVIFSLVDGIVLRPAGVPRGVDVVTFDTAASRATKFGDSSYPDYVDYARQTKDFLEMVVYRRINAAMNSGNSISQGRAKIIWGLLVSGNYFSMLDVKPILGRDFLTDEDQARGKSPVVIISYTLWQRNFNGDPHIIGNEIKLNGHVYTIIGVAPKSFSGLDLAYRPEIYLPMAMIADIVPVNGNQLLQSRQSRSFVIRGRLKPGVTIAQAQAEANVICANLTKENPSTNKDTQFILRHDLDYRMEGNGIVLPAVLLGLVLAVLLIACANVASLLMARASARLGAISTQFAIGATRGRLVCQFMTESTLLAVLGGAFGIGLAFLGIRLATSLVPYSPAPQGPLFSLDARVLLCALTASTLTIFLCGLAPAFMATRQAARAALRVRSSAPSDLPFGVIARRALIAAQVALSVILLIGGGLFLKAFGRLQKFDLGFNPSHVYVATMNPGLNGYFKEQITRFFKELRDRAAALPGVKSASLAAIPPFLGLYSQDISIDGYISPGGDNVQDTLTNRISPEYFDTLQIPFLEGRNFTEEDKADTPKVAIVNEAFARRFIVGTGKLDKAIGRVLRRRDAVPIQIVGIVKNSVYGITTPIGSPAAPVFYTPVLQFADSYMSVQVRTEGDPAGYGPIINQQIHDLDPEIAPFYSLPLSTVVSARSLFLPRVTAVLSGVFAAIALTLAVIGLYGVVSYTVATRTREIGIRMALGAQRSSVLGMILESSISLVAAGTAVGVLGALALTPLVSSLLVGVSPRDPAIFVLLPLLMLTVTAIASMVPALRATRVEPVTALRYE